LSAGSDAVPIKGFGAELDATFPASGAIAAMF
jgi:hypothetical protein